MHCCVRVLVANSLLLPLLAWPPLPPVKLVSPLIPDLFAQELREHPDQDRVSFVIQGLRHGFKVGFLATSPLSSSKRNKPSALQHPAIVDAYLANEVSKGQFYIDLTLPFGLQHPSSSTQ